MLVREWGQRRALTPRRTVCRLTNMLSAYTRGEPFSLDLASAVRRPLLITTHRQHADAFPPCTGPPSRNFHHQDARAGLDPSGPL